MIGAQLVELAVRRDRLQARAREQRLRVTDSLAQLAGPLESVDRAIAGVRWLRARPLIWVVGLVVVGVLRPRGLLAAGRLGLRLWAVKRALGGTQGRVALALLPKALDLYRRWRSR